MKSIWTPQPGEIPSSSRLAVFEKITAMGSPYSEKSPKTSHKPSDQEQYRMQETYSLFDEPESSRYQVLSNISEIDNFVMYPDTTDRDYSPVNYSPPFIRSRLPNELDDNSVTSTYQGYGEDDSRLQMMNRYNPEMERYIPVKNNPNIYTPRTRSHLLQPQNYDNNFTVEKMSHYSDVTTTYSSLNALLPHSGLSPLPNISQPKRYNNTGEQIKENSLLYIALTTPVMNTKIASSSLKSKSDDNITGEQIPYMSSYLKTPETTAYPLQENKYREDFAVGEMRLLSRRLNSENIENSRDLMENNPLIKTDNAQSPRRKLKSAQWTIGEESNQTMHKFGGDWPAISPPPPPKGFKIREGVKEVTELPVNTWITGQRLPSFKSCSFCRTNGETPEYFNTHPIRDRGGRVVCPVLRSHVCQICQATGDEAHTITYCPKVRNSYLGNQPLSTTIALKSSRIKSNGRRRY